MFELDEWNYDGEEDSSTVNKANITEVGYTRHFTLVSIALCMVENLHKTYYLASNFSTLRICSLACGCPTALKFCDKNVHVTVLALENFTLVQLIA